MSGKRQSPRASAADVQLSFNLADGEAAPATAHPYLRDADTVLSLLDTWHEAGWLQQLDIRFARFLHTEQPDAPGLLLLAAALTSHQLGRGHVCLDLAATLSGPHGVLDLPPESRLGDAELKPPTPAEVLRNVGLSAWEAALHPAIVSDGDSVTPLVYERGRLYLYRYWRYEQHVAAGISARLQAPLDADELPVARVRAVVDILFGAPAGTAPDWQRLACALAARSRFAVITGGPGTGKTTTVVRLLALLQALQYDHSGTASGNAPRPLRIQLAAPTGKAAARLSESIASKVNELPFDRLPSGDRLAEGIPIQVVTLHRLLGGRPHMQARRFHAGNPLPLDVLVIDEASMVSLADMAHVMAALRPDARLILIGDKDQLSSVEAGAVLGEICRRAADGHYRPDTVEWLEQATGMALPNPMIDANGTALDQGVMMLRVSHRFGSDSGIGRLAAAVNEGHADEALQAFDASPDDLAHIRLDAKRMSEFHRLLVDGIDATGVPHRRLGYGHYLDHLKNEPDSDDPQAFDAWAAEVLRAHRACQVLCVLRAGPWGVKGLNISIARTLHRRGLISAQTGWYVGRPIMVTRNNPALNLTNGDIGVVLHYPVAGSTQRVLRVAFLDESNGVRWFAPNRLDDVETVYALTVHKSQGSEFDHAVLVLPPVATAVLTRELVYTGITRASQGFTLVSAGGPEILLRAINQRVYRSGGLGDVLYTLR